MQHTFKPTIPYSSIAVVASFALGLGLSGEGVRLFFLLLAPLAAYHAHRVAVSLQFLELTPEGLASQGLFRSRSLSYGRIISVRLSRLTGDLIVRGKGVRLTIPSAIPRFGDLHFAVLTGAWAHGGFASPVETMGAEETYDLRPSATERMHAAYVVAAPAVWAVCLASAAGQNWGSLVPLLIIGGFVQAAMNLHSLRHLFTWYEIRTDGLVIHSWIKQQFLPAGEFLTSMVREDAQGRSLELAFFKQTVHLRFAFAMPPEELAGMLNQRWAAQASY